MYEDGTYSPSSRYPIGSELPTDWITPSIRCPMPSNIDAEFAHLRNEVQVAKAAKDQANHASEQAAINAMLATRAYHQAVDSLQDFLVQHDLTLPADKQL